MKNLTNVLILFGFLFLSHGLHAATEAPYQRAGIIQEIRFDENIIIISDEVYGILPQVLVNNNNKQKIGLNNLRVNLPIGYNLLVTGDKLTVKEAWILDKIPAGINPFWISE